MKLGFDLDKIFIDYPPFMPDALIDRLYKTKSNGVLLYRFPSSPEIFLRKISHLHFFRPPIRENISFIKKLSSQKHTLYLVSSRFSFLEEVTHSILKKYDIKKPFKNMYFNFHNIQPHIFKDTILSRLALDRYVDDDLPLVQYLAKRHKKTKFFWLNTRDKKRVNKNIIAITTLSDIVS